jgi:4-amino-4-deoxy-L-arabinose transferase-like glycosyltransferase
MELPTPHRLVASLLARSPLRVAAKRWEVFVVVGVLILASTFLFFYRLADRDLWSSHEARAAQNAQTILREGHWGLPKLFDGHPELQKPPLYYWLIALIAKARGVPVDAWAVRLPAALSALGGLLGVFGFLAWRGRPLAGFIAAVVLMTAIHYTWLARVGRIDMPLTLMVSIAIGCFYLARLRRTDFQSVRDEAGRIENPSYGLQLLGYLAIAAAIMLKGPIGAVLPAVVLGVHVFVERDWRLADWRPSWLLRSSLWWGVPLVLLLTVPWYWWANHETHGDFFRVFFWHHNLERGLGGSEDLRAHPWWFYGPRGFFDFLPWSPFVLVAGWYLVRRGGWREDPEARFGLLWLVGVLVLLSCARFKRSDYLLPAFPGAALLLGCVAERWYRWATRPRLLAGLFWGTALALACLAGWWVALEIWLPKMEPSFDQRPFAREIRRHAGSTYILFFRAESHALAFHLGYPLNTFLEWENLDIWAGRPGTHYIVMPAECAAEWQKHVTSGRLVELVRNTDLADGIPPHQQLVLMRTESHREQSDGTKQRVE